MRCLRCISIEPIKEEWKQEICRRCKVEFCCVPREKLNQVEDMFQFAEVLMCRDRDLSEVFLDKFEKLELIFIVSAGVEKIPFEYLQKRNIIVANSGGVSDAAMSDYVVGAMLLFSSKFKECIEYKSQHFWKPYLMTDTLKDKHLLIVGAGKIGQAIAKKAKAFDMKITGVRRKGGLLPAFDRIVSLDGLAEELTKADYVVCTMPLTENTYQLFDKDYFGKMRNTAVFINISRGKIVDEGALIDVLVNKRIKGAVLDVFENEPLAAESVLWELDNVVLTPHSSGRIEDYLKYAVDIFIRCINQYMCGETMDNRVDLGYRY